MTTGGREAVVLVAHGSADRRAAAATRALARAVRAARPGLVVRPAYLDHAGPRPGQVLAALAGTGHARATVVPLLLTSAYHCRVDLPALLAEARAGGLGLPVAVTDPLGPAGGTVPALLLAALRRRLAGLRPRFDAVVLAAAGTRDPAARATVAAAAAALGESLGLPCRAGYASTAVPTVPAAVGAVRADGGRRVAAAGYFLAPGRLYAAAADSARAAGAVAVTRPLGAARELAQLVLHRLDGTAIPAVAAPVRELAGRVRQQNAPGAAAPGASSCGSVLGFRKSGRGGGCRCGA
jgi:sirohydrochlorin ferrochelatase